MSRPCLASCEFSNVSDQNGAAQCLDNSSGASTAAVEAVVPVVKDVEEQEEEGDEAKGLDRMEKGAIAVGVAAGCEHHDHEP